MHVPIVFFIPWILNCVPVYTYYLQEKANLLTGVILKRVGIFLSSSYWVGGIRQLLPFSVASLKILHVVPHFQQTSLEFSYHCSSAGFADSFTLCEIHFTFPDMTLIARLQFYACAYGHICLI